ncbi:MAG: heavy-metal-associated domain-containing protein [Segetibacter sp.]
METLKLKTNINCGGCVAKVTPSLNETIGENNWQVDTQNPNKILTVSGTEVNKDDVIKAVKKAGFKAEEVA